MCNCLAEINGLLKEKNLMVDTTLPYQQVTLPDSGNTIKFGPVRPCINTCHIEKPKRGSKTMNILAKFCPFCGAEYEPKQEATP